jgi:UDP-2-acetamido-3-amino-2,3-dideoxy-glucuronate N-acetyltransferase
MAALIHPLAFVEATEIGDGTRVWAFAQVMKGAIVGADCNIGGHAFIEGGALLGDRVTVKNQVMIWSGVTIEDDVFLGPGVIFTNDRRPRSPRMPEVAGRYRAPELWLGPTRVCRGASLGAGAIVLCDLTIGQFALVGAGAVVTRTVAPHALMVGNPARRAGWVCMCGAKLDEKLACTACKRNYRLSTDNDLVPRCY